MGYPATLPNCDRCLAAFLAGGMKLGYFTPASHEYAFLVREAMQWAAQCVLLGNGVKR